MSFPAPPMPVFPPGQSTTTTSYLRYEDVAQDGRLMPGATPAALAGLWRDLLVDHPGARNALGQGIVPILTRLTLRSHDASIRVDHPVRVDSGFLLAHDRDAAGEVTRLYMNVWAKIHGIAGRLGRQPASDAHVLAGEVFAEHTFTRLLAPPGQRGLIRLGVEGYPDVPDVRYAAPAATTAAEPLDGARWLDAPAADPVELAFTLDQTDSNQHVNSLVYVRAFLEATNRRLAAAGRSLAVRSRAIDIAYRKPCFAGDRVRVHAGLFEHDGAVGAAGHVEGSDGKPRCFVRVALG
jgi:hypothetical protein